MKKKKLSIIVISMMVICIVIAVVQMFFLDVPRQIVIEEKVYKIIGGNLFYTDELLEFKGKNQDIISCYNVISDYMKKEYPDTCFIIENFNQSLEVDKMIFNGCQVIDSVLIESVGFNIEMKNKEVEEIWFPTNRFVDIQIDKNDLITEEEIKNLAFNLSKENYDSMLKNDSHIIEGEYYLTYYEERLCYNVILNDCSNIILDAKTGEVLDTYFFNGIVF